MKIKYHLLIAIVLSFYAFSNAICQITPVYKCDTTWTLDTVCVADSSGSQVCSTYTIRGYSDTLSMYGSPYVGQGDSINGWVTAILNCWADSTNDSIRGCYVVKWIPSKTVQSCHWVSNPCVWDVKRTAHIACNNIHLDTLCVDTASNVYPVTCHMDTSLGLVAVPTIPAGNAVACKIAISHTVTNATVTITPKPISIVLDTSNQVHLVADIKLSAELSDAMQSAQIVLSYAELNVSDPSKLKIFYVNGSGNLVDDVTGITINTYAKTVTGTVAHFSSYALIETNSTTPDETPLVTLENGLYISPNPCNPSTNVIFSMASNEAVHLAVYNVAGGLVKQLVNRKMTAGKYSVVWDGSDRNNAPVSSGRYIVRMTAGGNSLNRTVNLVR